eukprot:TCALIF_10603-PA protein Name:"Similar to SF1 Splicing factor 1 (Homo sapiens)" AED:0.14 eAED:0.14 QI:107/0.6/0.5/1/1/1/6/113/717
MSGGRYHSSGANNTPLGAIRPAFPPSVPTGGSSLLKPNYLSGGGLAPGPPLGGGGVGASDASDDVKKKLALETILKFNAEQAKKRAALGESVEPPPPPVVGGMPGMPGAGPLAAGSFGAPFQVPYMNAPVDDGSSLGGGGLKREHDSEEAAARAERRKKRKSRWGGGEDEKTFIPGMPTMMPQGLSKEQEEAYLLQLKIEDTSRRLRSGDFGIPINPEDRSPSPEPIYSSDGKRMNTREYRKRRELEELRHNSITRMVDINPEYKPPPDYKPPMVKVSDKVMIPQDEHPDINFVAMEKDTGAKIIIRGKGSVKEGKVGRKDGQPLPGEDEPLHAYVTANNPEAVKKAVDKIKEIIKQGVEVPEGHNDLRRTQLRELALLNGTLREGDGPRCTNCGASDHKSWQCQDKPNYTNNIICSMCGGAGHIARDCQQRRHGGEEYDEMGEGSESGGGGGGGGVGGEGKTKMDDEYMSLMAELGEGPPPPAPAPDRPSSKPWQRGSGNVFTPRHQAPRAIMGPRGGGGGGPPPPPPGEYGPPSHSSGWSSGGGGGKPPNLMQQSVPPPWHQGGSGGGGSWNQPPPPGAGPPPPPPPGTSGPRITAPPPSGGWGSQSTGAGGYGMPPPYMGGPPPPPGSSSSGGSGYSMASQWGSAPPPPPGSSAPPPRPPPGAAAYWQNAGWSQGAMLPPPGAPPPPPPGANGSPNGLNISRLIAAPPPPPPSS